MIAGLGLGFTSINPIKALFYSAVINGVVAVPLMVVTGWSGLIVFCHFFSVALHANNGLGLGLGGYLTSHARPGWLK